MVNGFDTVTESQPAAISADPEEDELIAPHLHASSRLLPAGLLVPDPNPTVPLDPQLGTLTPKAATLVAISEQEPAPATQRCDCAWGASVGLAALIACCCAFPILFAHEGHFGASHGFVGLGDNAFGRTPTDCFAFVAFLPVLGAVYFTTEARSLRVALALFKRFAWGWFALPVTLLASVLSIILVFAALDSMTNSVESPRVVDVIYWAATTLCIASVEFGIYLFSPSKDWIRQIVSPRRFVLYDVFSTLGLGTGEVYFWVLFSQRTVKPDERGPYLARTLISCVVFLIPIQVLCSYYIGLGAAHREAMKTKLRPIRFILLPLAGRWVSLTVVLGVSLLMNPHPL